MSTGANSSRAWPTSVIAGVQGALPPNRYSQSEITEALIALPQFAPHADLLRRFHQTAKVNHRHLAMPLEKYSEVSDFGYTNSVFIDTAVELGCAAVSSALEDAGFGPQDVDMIMSTTVTGIAVPSLEARIAGRLGMRPDVRRAPLFGLGCVAGAAGTARVHDYLRGNPDGVAVLVSAELCSLNFGALGADIAGLVGTALFADGAAAVVFVGERRAEKLGITGPRIIDSASRLYPRVGQPPRRPEGHRGDHRKPHAARRRAGAHLALASRNRQRLVVVSAAHPARHPVRARKSARRMLGSPARRCDVRLLGSS